MDWIHQASDIKPFALGLDIKPFALDFGGGAIPPTLGHVTPLGTHVVSNVTGSGARQGLWPCTSCLYLP